MERLRLWGADEELANWLSEAVGQARRAGRSWAEIGDALGVTRQAAWKLYNNPLRAAIDQARAEARLTDDEAIAVANEELRPFGAPPAVRAVLDPNVIISSLLSTGATAAVSTRGSTGGRSSPSSARSSCRNSRRCWPAQSSSFSAALSSSSL